MVNDREQIREQGYINSLDRLSALPLRLRSRALLLSIDYKARIKYYIESAIVYSDSYDQALKKLKAAESRSDLPAESSVDIKTRHDRCRISRSSEDEVPKNLFRAKRI
jgi:hypothetical protein